MGVLADLILGKAKPMPNADFEKIKELSEKEIRELAESHVVDGRQDQKLLGILVLFLLHRIEELEVRLGSLESRASIRLRAERGRRRL